MFLAIALTALVQGGDSLVTPLETGGLSYQRTYKQWTEVTTDRRRANRAGFGSVAYPIDSGQFALEFRIYGDSTAQYSQWKRLERLLNEPLTWTDRTNSLWQSAEAIESVNSGSLEDVDANRAAQIAYQDSLEVQRHISISDVYREVHPSDPPSTTSTAPISSEPPSEVLSTPILLPLSESVSAMAQNTSESTKDPKEAPTAAQETAESKSAKPPASPEKATVVRTEPPGIPVQKSRTSPVGVKASTPASSKTKAQTSTHPFGSSARYAIVFASFSEEANALRYLEKVVGTFPEAKVWFVKDMYRVGWGSSTYPGSTLQSAQQTYPKAWVIPL